MQFYNGVSYFYGHYAFQFCLLQKVNDLREFFKRRQVKIFLIFWWFLKKMKKFPLGFLKIIIIFKSNKFWIEQSKNLWNFSL